MVPVYGSGSVQLTLNTVRAGKVYALRNLNSYSLNIRVISLPYGRKRYMTKSFWNYAWRGKNLGHCDLEGFNLVSEPKFRTEFPFFAREKWPELRRKRDLYEPLLTTMAQVLPFPIYLVRQLVGFF